MIGLWILLGLLVVASVLLTIAIGGYSDLAAENRRLLQALVNAHHPSARIAPGENPIFDVTLAEIQALAQLEADTAGGAA